MQDASPHEKAQGFHVHLEDDDIAALMQALVTSNRRIQRLELPMGVVWIKRQGTEKRPLLIKLQFILSKFLPRFMRPSLPLDGAGLMHREILAMEAFRQKGFPVPPIFYSSQTAVVLGNVGLSIASRLDRLRDTPAEHDELLIQSAQALGQVHGAGLCHGRPHVRDFFLQDGRIGFMDFEERPQEVMPMETAQARDIWLLFLQIASRARDGRKTCDEAFRRWQDNASPAALSELRRLVRILGRFLPLARLIGRVRMGSDLQRFILATDYLKNAVETEAAG